MIIIFEVFFLMNIKQRIPLGILTPPNDLPPLLNNMSP